ncbi:hypothetical protein GUJ93_ZPchr0006g46373 [Zizania palustris]|uniref:Uncharacterized protein n=1 Tax=Zizania palustris TaxID=103762 RepID=A0A8J5W1L9_ZIZPA|nr:hypothetical protein GUJ93_ZPchr0006g46373 [Zizania palustris]
MKRRRRDLLIFMSTKKAGLAAVVGKCRELWEGLFTGSGCAGVAQPQAHSDGGGYFGRSYEFSCSATPDFAPPARGSGRRPRCQLLPCVGGSRSPDCAGHDDDEIDVLADEFIRRFREQLRIQVADEQLLTTSSSSPSHAHVASAP